MNTKKIRLTIVALTSGLLLFNVAPMLALADNPLPSTTSISPSQVVVGSSGFSLTINGNNFVTDSIVYFNGNARSTTYVSSGQLTASIPSADVDTAGTFAVTVINLGPGGGTSNAQTFTVANVLPSVSFISPSSIASGSMAFILTVDGANFMPGSTVNFNGNARSTAYVSSSRVTATITAADVINSGTFSVTVSNPGPGGGTSNVQTLIVTGTGVNPLPFLGSIFPSSVTAGSGSFTLTVHGSGFNTNSAVRFNGLARITTLVSSTQLTAIIPASDVAMTQTHAVSVSNPTPGGGTSGSLLFTILPVTTTPGLPNTGFGPVGQTSAWASLALVILGISLAGIVLIGSKIIPVWLKK